MTSRLHPVRLPAVARSIGVGTLAYLAAAPLLATLHQLLVLGAATVLRALETPISSSVLPRLPVDPVYGGAALHILCGIQPRGIALAGALGDALHRAWPLVFAPSGLVAERAAVSVVLEPGATVVAGALATLIAALPLLALGIGLARGRRIPAWLAFAGALLQAHVLVAAVVESELTLRELEATGLPFALAALAPVGEGGQRALFTREFADVSEAALSLSWGLCLAVIAYLIAAGFVLTPVGVRQLLRPGRRASAVADRERWAFPARLWNAAWRGSTLAALALILTLSPLAPVARGKASFPTPPAPVTPSDPSLEALVDTLLPDQDPSPAAPSGSAAPAPSAPHRGPSHVTIEGRGYRYTYRVDGEPTTIRGMGYNPWYAKLDPAERRHRYERDFRLMEAIGINTLEGWFQDQFDEVTLDVADDHGLGVIMPFELNHDYDYSDPRIQAIFMEDVAMWVLRYKDQPAVRMWGPGNELLHRLIFPTMVGSGPDPAREARADQFATFYVELIDMVHALDPHHPVVYRDAEDLYLWRIRVALLRDGKPRPWFVYGTNAYTPRLQEVIQRWPEQGLDAPLLVSEFSPGGVAPADRPHKLGWFWSVIRSRPEMVLGGVVYTWATEGPEDLDRVFGLTDVDGRPVDGSLAALSRLFLSDAATQDGPS